MKDIAEYLNISVVTVSKALADKDGVSESLRQKIKKTANDLGYRKKTKSNEHKPKEYNMGILLPERLKKPEHSFYWALYLSLIDTLKENGYYSYLELLSDESEKSLRLPNFLSEKRVDGIMLLGAVNCEYATMLSNTQTPLVLLDFYCDNPNISSVITDSFLGGYDLTSYLIGKGHTKIGYVGSIKPNHNAQDRFFGYKKALFNHSLSYQEDWIIQDKNTDGSTFLEEFKLPKEMPTAFFCSNDQCAYHFVKYLIRNKFNIPQDVSIIGFYDHVFSLLLEPNISTYRINLKKMSKKAVTSILEQISGLEPERRSVVSGNIIERQSVRQLI